MNSVISVCFHSSCMKFIMTIGTKSYKLVCIISIWSIVCHSSIKDVMNFCNGISTTNYATLIPFYYFLSNLMSYFSFRILFTKVYTLFWYHKFLLNKSANGHTYFGGSILFIISSYIWATFVVFCNRSTFIFLTVFFLKFFFTSSGSFHKWRRVERREVLYFMQNACIQISYSSDFSSSIL